MMYEINHQHEKQQKIKADMRKSVSFNGRVNDNRRRKSNDDNDKLQIVDLSGMSLDSLPNPSLNLGVISNLDLSNNNLQIIPESLIARLLNVVILDVHSNQLRSLPNSIGCLSKLKVLNVSGNLIESIPRTIENCRSLEELNANFNKLDKLPDTIGFELHNLRKLSVNSNKIAYLPNSLTHLTSLRVLDARLNCLRALPEDLENLINLETLNVSQNFRYLTALPYSVGLLLSLIDLDVSYNCLSALPDSLGCLRKLKRLSVEGNQLVAPPPEVVERGVQAVKEYMAERMNNDRGTQKKSRSSWVGRLKKYSTFNGSSKTVPREGFMVPDYLASPRYSGMFSPLRIFSPRRA